MKPRSEAYHCGSNISRNEYGVAQAIFSIDVTSNGMLVRDLLLFWYVEYRVLFQSLGLWHT
jgi:hypothetical protein